MTEEKHYEILHFIALIRNSSWKLQRLIFTGGACYQFYRILKNRFPDAVAYHDGGHVITRIGDHYYDIMGEITETAKFSEMEREPTYWGRRFW